MLTTNSLIFGGNSKLLDDFPDKEQVSDNWKKRQRYISKCKKAAWKRWVYEYLAAPRERGIKLAIKRNL